MTGRWMALACALVVMGTATGCIEEKVELQLEPDGRGKVQIERIMGAQMSSMATSMGSTKEQALESSAADAMAEFQGIDAWTDIETFTSPDGKLGFRATGWFADPTQLRRVSDKNETRFVIERADGKLRARVERSAVTDTSGKPDRQDEMFTSSDQQFQQQRTMTKGMLGPMLADLHIEIAVAMPADVGEVSGFTKDGHRAAWALDGKALTTMIDGVFERVAALRPRVKSGELTVAQAKEQVEHDFPDVTSTSDFSAECTLPPEDAAGKTAYDTALASAKVEWAASTWQQKLEEARAKAARKAQMGGAPRERGGRPGGAPGSGTPGNGTPGSGTPGSGTPGSGTPGNGTPGNGTPGNGTPGSGGAPRR